jgi:hypothetical protein
MRLAEMTKHPPPIQFRPTPEDEARLKALQRHLQEIVPPGMRVTRTDVMRYALQTSASNIPAGTPTATTGPQRKR